MLHVSCSTQAVSSGLPKEAEERLWDGYQMNKVVLDSVQNDAMQLNTTIKEAPLDWFCQPSLEGHEYLVVEDEITEAVFMCGGLKKLCRRSHELLLMVYLELWTSLGRR